MTFPAYNPLESLPAKAKASSAQLFNSGQLNSGPDCGLPSLPFPSHPIAEYPRRKPGGPDTKPRP